MHDPLYADVSQCAAQSIANVGDELEIVKDIAPAKRPAPINRYFMCAPYGDVADAP
jgi:hypothetical protein